MKTRILTSVAAIIGLLFIANAQDQNIIHCGSTEYRQNLIKNHPEVELQYEKFRQYQTEFVKNYRKKHLTTTAPQKFIIPIVFHIIHNYGPENISDAQVFDAMRILNLDYSKQNPDTNVIVSPFNDIIGDVNVEWRLAQLDPNGNCTNGIERIPSLQTYIGEEGAKIDQWPRADYMNVWVVSNILIDNFQAAGYALFPSDVAGQTFPLDGVMILSTYIGSIGTAQPGCPGCSRALTHELGHTLSLLHPFGPDNSCGTACGSAGIDDLPSTFGFCSCPDPIAVTCNVQTVTGSYNYILTDTTTGTVDPTPVGITFTNPTSTTMDTLLTISPFSANGVSANSTQSQTFAFSKWDTGAVNQASSIDSMKGTINLNKYYQVTLGNVVYSKAFAMTSVKFTAGRTATGPRMFSVRSSVDNFTNNLKLTPSNLLDSVVSGNLIPQGANTIFMTHDSATVVQCVLNCNSTTNAALNAYRNTPITFRFYAWNAEDTVGAFVFDQATVSFEGGINENVQNFMDYSYCSHMFTVGQAISMQMALTNTYPSTNSGRNNLWTFENLKKSGVIMLADTIYFPKDSVTTAIAQMQTVCNASKGAPVHAVMVSKSSSAFGSVDNEVCVGTPIFFEDESWGDTITSRRWTFPTGTINAPGTSTSQSLSVTYTTPGWKDVSLWVQNDRGGMDSIYVSKKVFVSPSGTAQFPNNYTEGFEDPTEVSANWFVNNYSNNSTFWYDTDSAAYTGKRSMVMHAWYVPTVQMPLDPNVGDIDELISPSIDFDSVTAPYYMSFKYSYATRAYNPADMGETFAVMYSTSCGKTWTLLDSSLTVGDNPTHSGHIPAISVTTDDFNSFIPNSPDLWFVRSIALPAGVLGKSDVRFKFIFNSGITYNLNQQDVSYANNLYIDDINISSAPQSINEHVQPTYSLNVFPNPANDAATVVYQLQSKQNIELAIYDVVGNKIVSLARETQEEGTYSYKVSKQSLAAGLYFIRLNVDNKSSAVKKFIMIE